MQWELDHVFFATTDAEAVEKALADFGIAFTERRVHSGQGTANACAVFENAFFEVLRPHDLAELRSSAVQPLGLEERMRWRETGASPFGLCFRGESCSFPFETWQYQAAYLPAGSGIPIVTPAGLHTDPLVFISSQAKRSTDGSPEHHGARRTLTRVTVERAASATPLSSGVRWFVENGFLSLRDGRTHLLELEWDHGREGKSQAFPAAVPIIVRW
jgi:glyoxalase-like protein